MKRSKLGAISAVTVGARTEEKVEDKQKKTKKQRKAQKIK